jgi:hypothetical protein
MSNENRESCRLYYLFGIRGATNQLTIYISVGCRINLPLLEALRYLAVEPLVLKAHEHIRTHKDQHEDSEHRNQRYKSGFRDQGKAYAFAPS